MKLIDVHTHNSFPTKHLSIKSVNYDQIPPTKQPYTIGFHPWSLNSQLNKEIIIQELKEKLLKHSALALGEIGLDKVKCALDLPEQIAYFHSFVKLAQELKINCLIIHCVRAYDEICQALISLKYSGKVILHDYNGNKEQTKSLLTHENIYFSYCHALMKKERKGFQSLNLISLDRLFLETDDQIDYTIEDLYQELCHIKNISMEQLNEQISKNARECFSNLNIKD